LTVQGEVEVGRCAGEVGELVVFNEAECCGHHATDCEVDFECFESFGGRGVYVDDMTGGRRDNFGQGFAEVF
jgi:hypothetical protein